MATLCFKHPTSHARISADFVLQRQSYGSKYGSIVGIVTKTLTEELVFMGRLLKIRVLDHLIIGENRYYSFADEGLIDQYAAAFNARRGR